MDDRDTLLKEIGEVSFFLDDLRLYLDTHPQEERALGALPAKSPKAVGTFKNLRGQV